MPRKHLKAQHKPGRPVSRKHRGYHRSNLMGLWAVLGISALVVAGFLLLRPQAGPAPAQLTTAEAYQKYEAGIFFLDVRTTEEWDEFHLAGSTHIPLDELPDRLNELPGDEEIVVVCRSGRRSLSGAAILEEAGFPLVSSMEGGLQAWMDAGYPVEGDNP